MGSLAARRSLSASGNRTTHTAVVLSNPGPSSKLSLVRDHPLASVNPSPKDNSVNPIHRNDLLRVKVSACGVCHRDLLDRSGAFPFIRPDAVIGHEVSGVVEAVGDGYKGDMKPGDRVLSLHWASCGKCEPCARGDTTECRDAWNSFLGLTTDGGYAEYVVSPESMWYRPPKWFRSHFSAVEAAPMVCTYGTAWHAAITRGELRKGETVLVTGAAGGVGSAMVQVAGKMGCEVIGVTSDAGKADHIRSLGAKDVIVVESRGASFHRQVIEKTGGVDMAFETVGAPTFSSSLRSLSAGGRLVLIGNVTNSAAELPLGLAIVKGLSVIGSDSCTRSEMDKVAKFLKKNGIRPAVDAVLPLGDVQIAHDRLVSSRGVSGRIVLGIDPEGW